MATALGFGARPQAPEVKVPTFFPIAQMGDRLADIPESSRAGAKHLGVVTVSEGTTRFEVLAFPTIKANSKIAVGLALMVKTEDRKSVKFFEKRNRLIRETVAAAYKQWLSEVTP
jgi:hypothetical protein